MVCVGLDSFNFEVMERQSASCQILSDQEPCRFDRIASGFDDLQRY
jgi:hypothetical protein